MPIAKRIADRVADGRERDVAGRIDQARHGFSHRLRSAHTWIVAARSVGEVVDALHVDNALMLLPTLGGMPIRCADVRAMGRRARLDDELLIVDNSLATSFGCQASLLGAHVTIELLDRVMGGAGCGMAAVSVSRDARAVCNGIWERLDALPRPSDEDALELASRLDGFDGRLRQSNDVAQTTALYLACHPRVASVAYPGLPRDASFDVAARTLRNGFGPALDFRLDGVSREEVESIVSEARRGFSELDASDWHQTSVEPLGPLGGPEATCWLRLTTGPCGPKEVVQALEAALGPRTR